MPPALTSLSHGAGCGCKLPAAALGPVLAGLPAGADPRVLVDASTRDDAGVIRLSDELALVQTVDFFTPVVDDPYDFGRIAATNALSDVYAMGATPVTALNVLAWPLDTLGEAPLREVLRGGAEAVAAAGATIVGGHSIDDPEPKYGLAVTGVVHPEALLTNAGAHAGDVLVLTKPLGAGAIVTAAKRGSASAALVGAAVEVMTTSNAAASAAAVECRASALTDVTGFGLLGHLNELAEASGLAAEIDAGAVPALPGALDLLGDGDGAWSGGSARNLSHAAGFTTFADGVELPLRRLAADAMTSGGLLAAVPAERAGGVPGPVVGRLVAGAPGSIRVRR